MEMEEEERRKDADMEERWYLYQQQSDGVDLGWCTFPQWLGVVARVYWLLRRRIGRYLVIGEGGRSWLAKRATPPKNNPLRG
jgi:hypothetical protein